MCEREEGLSGYETGNDGVTALYFKVYKRHDPQFHSLGKNPFIGPIDSTICKCTILDQKSLFVI